MDEQQWLAQRFEAHRSQLRAMAYRMLGSASEADDALQEAWLRLRRSDISSVQNLGGWLTTVVGRVCLDMLRSRTARREEPLDAQLSDTVDLQVDDPEQEALLSDSIGLAMLVVLDTLAPAERLAFVLHDMFAVPYREIAPILDRSTAATKMLTSRARQRIQMTETIPDASPARQRAVVNAFLAASRGGDFEALVAMLDPNAVLRSDHIAVQMGAATELRGATSVATFMSGHAQAARPALVDGAVGAAWAPGGTVRAIFNLTVADGKVTAIDVIADPVRIDQFKVQFLPHRQAAQRRGGTRPIS